MGIKEYLRESKLTWKLISAVAIALLIFFFIGLYTVQSNTQYNFEQLIEKQKSLFNAALRSKLQSKEKTLSGIQGLISTNTDLQEAFKSRDKELLQNLADPTFRHIKNELAITHFYFTDLNRVNYLRVHAFQRDGDIINRQTMLQAELTGQQSLGLELGPLGSFTLRSVIPWFDKNQQKIGYLELGIDLAAILREIAEQNGFNVLLTINKSLLDKSLWTEGNRIFGNQTEWEKYKDIVVSKDSMVSKSFLQNLPNFASKNQQTEQLTVNKNDIQKIADGYYYWVQLPINDVNDNKVADIYVALDMSDWFEHSHSTAYQVIALCFAVSCVLIIIIYRNTYRAEKAEKLLNKSVEKLELLARYDQLTGLPNRQKFIEELKS